MLLQSQTPDTYPQEDAAGIPKVAEKGVDAEPENTSVQQVEEEQVQACTYLKQVCHGHSNSSAVSGLFLGN